MIRTESKHKRIRIGIDVGGTFTKAVAIEAGTGGILSRSSVPTTHSSPKGVSEGIVTVLQNVLADPAVGPQGIELISHSTTQAINALLESDTSTVGIVAMGVGPEKKSVVKRTNLQNADINAGRDISVEHEFLDTSRLISEGEASSCVRRLRDRGAKVIVATEAYGVDDPSNELFVMEAARRNGIPAAASHEISGIYGLEIRTLTAAVNASVLPKTYQVANFVESAIRDSGVDAPLMIMKGDGGVTTMDTFRTRPILTVLSGPAASVAGALLHLRITDGVFVEVGGTSTNICIIRNGRSEIRYMTVKDHPTCIRSMDVRVLGVAGGSMVRLRNGRVFEVGPRSAHIANLGYACWADPHVLKEGRIVLKRPSKDDTEEYAVIRCRDEDFAITCTCAANALGMIGPGDHSRADQESARIALEMLGRHIGVSYTEIATSVIQTASFQITRAVTKILDEFKISPSSAQMIGGGGGASVLAPFAAKQLDMPYEKAVHAEVISSIGAAMSMLREEMEFAMSEPTPERMSGAARKAHAALVGRGAVPESVLIDTEYVPEKALLRVTAVGNVELDSAETSKSVFTAEEAQRRAGEMIGMTAGQLPELEFETDHYLVFSGSVEVRRLFGRRSRRHLLVLDRFGRQKLSLKNARLLLRRRSGGVNGEAPVPEQLDNILGSGRGVAPRVFLLDDMRLMDFSGLTSPSRILDAVRHELGGPGRAAVIVEL